MAMQWAQVRQNYANQWLVIEALTAHTENNQHWIDQLAVIETCPDGHAAMARYRQLRQRYPAREFCFVHTSRERLDFDERQWLGVRRGDATHVAR
jgi:hypothetical protein